jgi:ABC-2 type transport system permease protein
MILRLMNHEWRSLRGDATLVLVAVLFGGCLAYGMWNGIRFVAGHAATLDQVVAEETARLDDLRARTAALDAGTERVSPFADPRNPDAFARRLGPRYAVLPPTPLAALSIGQSDLLPAYYKVSSEAREVVLAATEIENPHRLLTGPFDLAFVVIYLYPLMILALSYHLLSQEKEQGTLALLLSQPLRLRDVVVGKVCVRALLFVALVAGVAVLGLLVAGTSALRVTTLARFGLWVAVVTAYGGVWFALAVWVASFGRGSSTNAMVLAGLWLVLVILLPALFNLAATTLYPVPSRVEMIQAMRDASDEATARGSQLLAEFYEHHPELAADSTERAANDFAVIRLAVADSVEREVRPGVEHYEAQLERQQALVAQLRPLSPAIVAQDAINDLAGSGTARHRHFVSQVDRFHERWRAYFAPKIVRRAQVGSFDDLPAFVYEEEPGAAVTGRVAIALAWLVVPGLAIAVVGLRRLARYPVAA